MHLEHDELTLLALGEGGRDHADGAAAAHLAECPQCRAELADLSAVVEQVRQAEPIEPVPADELPPGLWERIAAQVEEEPSASTPVSTSVTSPVDDPRDEVSRARDARAAEEAASSRATSRYLIAIAAAVGIGVGTIATAHFSDSEAPEVPAEAVVAATDLEVLEDGLAGANARIVDRDGQQVLIVETDELADADGGYLEVWLIDTAVEGMVTLGPLDADTQEFVLPTTLDVAAFPIVDISREPLDGDPTHSGASLWRGNLAPEQS